MDKSQKINRTPITKLIKSLFVAASFYLASPVFGEAKQELTCYSKFYAADFDSAFGICSKAAEEGNAGAQYNLGLMYSSGAGTQQDYEQAFYWYTKAAEQGVAKAQFNLGVRHDNGEGTPQDDKQAIYWYSKAAGQGHADAQVNLGLMYYTGEGTPKDAVMAYFWWNVAVVQGNTNAENNRAVVEKEMTPSQIAEAQKLSKECYAK